MNSKILITIACLLIILVFLKWSSSFFAPVFFAFTLTLLFWPAIQWLKNKGMPRGLAILTISVSVLLGIVLLLLAISYSATQLVDKLPYYEQSLNKQLAPLYATIEGWGVDINSIALVNEANTPALAKAALNFVTAVILNVSNVLFFLLMLLFMIIASDSVVAKFTHHYKKGHAFMTSFFSWSKNIQQQYRVQTTNNFISAVIATLIFYFMQIDFAILWGFFAFVFAYIPNIGIIISSIPPVIIAFILFGTWYALLVIIIITILNLVMDNVVNPRLMGRELQIPAFFVFFSFVFWTWIFGPLGAFLSLPITLAIRSLLLQNQKSAYFAEFLTEDIPQENIKKKDKKKL